MMKMKRMTKKKKKKKKFYRWAKVGWDSYWPEKLKEQK
jgi:hypothetical protein